MVGMDYAGKYIGGFIGMNDTYSPDATVKINGKDVNGKGTFYINCYAAGEVGNILTVTDKGKADKFEDEFFSSKLDVTQTEISKILNYYPTGGFAGVLNIDHYQRGGGFGNFYNCYYDMQTTAMHEMAVGLADVNVSSSSSSPDGTKFSIPGVKSLYTQSSKVKDVDGLTDMKYMGSDDDGGVWNYEAGYYPQLNVFMQFDLNGSGELAALEAQSEIAKSNSPFYIAETEGSYDGSESHVVAGFDSEHEIITAYRYSQASTSTVLLNHWDYRMNIADGTLATDNDWACAVGQNKLTYNDETGFFENTYRNLAAGQYEFKIQANNNMSYNYGSDKFDGRPCVLNVPFEDCTVIIKFRYSELRSNNYQIYAVIYDSDGQPLDENGNRTDGEKLILLGGSETQVVSETWTIAGNLPYSGWDVANTDYDMKLCSDGSGVYKHTHYIEPDKNSEGDYIPTAFQFKIAKDHSWNESYGISGGSDNMGFTLSQPCDVTFTFNSKTHITTITASNAEYISEIATENKLSFDFEGYSVIGQSSLTGYNWLQSGSELEAAKRGEMKEISSGVYQVTFDQVKMGQNYAYKVIKDAVDEGANSYFYINSHTVNKDATCSVTFTYDSETGETEVTATSEGYDGNPVLNIAQASFYTVLGSEELTGYFWLGDQSHPQDQSEEAKEEYRLAAIENGRMETEPGTPLYRKTFSGVPAGTYGFKVAADGSLDLSWGENDSNENYSISLKETADVTITFNKEKNTISVATNPSGALNETVYVVTGTKNLMGKTWDLNDAVMVYNEEEGIYEYTKENVKSGNNYSFKVIEKGVDSGDNRSFYLDGSKAAYNVRFIYNSKNDIVRIEVYDIEDESKTEVTEDVIKPVKITSYSVLGDKGLTGNNWLGLTDNGGSGTEESERKASEDGAMTKNPDGTYTKTYSNIKVGSGGEVESYVFKIAANGNWDSGIAYGDETGNNYMLLLNGDGSNVTTCDVTINFDPETGRITVETSPSDCNLAGIDDSKFDWYVVGDYQLVSYDSFKASATVYDTVRDITSGFEFTSGKNSGERGITWQIDSDRNKISGFYSRLGNGTGFSLDYIVEGKEATGTFNTPVIDLMVDVVSDNYGGTKPDENIAHYYCESFMPGKQWLSISALGYGYSTQYSQWKTDYLAYVEYLDNQEKFNETAEIYYKVLAGQLQSNTPETLIQYMNALRESGGEKEVYYQDLLRDYGDIITCYQNIQTVVSDPGVAPVVTDQSVVGMRNLRLIPTVYLEAGNDAEVSVFENGNAEIKNSVKYDKNSSSDVTFNGISDNGYSYYNFAFTAGYAITDKIGLGIYDNYINQKHQDNEASGHGIRKFNSGIIREQDDTEMRKYDSYYAMTSVFHENASYNDSEDKGLVVDKTVKQSVIGSSYDYGMNGDQIQYGQTIVKVYKVSDSGVHSKINMSNDSGSPNSAEYLNYQKWTGQTKFTAEDEGLYSVVFYWLLFDGRYLSDSKLVTIDALQPGVTKKVDTVYDEAGDKNTLTYTVTYTNSDFSSPVTFSILDVLPYSGDTRVGYGDERVTGTTGSDVKFNIQSLNITQSGAAAIKGVYYSQDDKVRNYLRGTGQAEAASDVAQKLHVDEDGRIHDSVVEWKDITRAEIGGGGTYTPANAEGVTAVAVSGIQLAVSESITISITVTYEGLPNDIYVNNAFFYAYAVDNEEGVNGSSKPVTTAIIGRSLNGYVWLDKDIDGLVDEGEERFQGVTLSLYVWTDDRSAYVDTGRTAITDEEGLYSFDGLPEGRYKVALSKEKNAEVCSKPFESYEQTKKLLEARADQVIGSRNLALVETDTDGTITSYNVNAEMPGTAEIYRGSYTDKINTECDGFKYTKSYLNIGLTDSKCSISLFKKGESDAALNGVAFKLEYQNAAGEWVQVVYDEDGYVLGDKLEEGTGISEFITGETMPDGSKEEGKIILPNLPEGRYRITEIRTVDGYNLLASSIEVELPYKVKKDNSDTNNIIRPSNTSPSYSDSTYNYYRDITFTISNTTNLNDFLPLTGTSEFCWLILAGLPLILIGAALLYVSKKRKKEKDSKYVI